MTRTFVDAGVLIAAVMMLTFHSAWMSRHGRKITADLTAMGKAVGSGDKTLLALAAVVGLVRVGRAVHDEHVTAPGLGDESHA